MWVWDVEDPGAGNVERNIVLRIMIPQLVRNFLQQKIIMIPFVVKKKKDSKKKIIVLEVIQGTVPSAGSYARERIELSPASSRSASCFIRGYS